MPDIVSAKPTAGAPVESAWGGEVHDWLEGIQYGSGVNVNMGGAINASVAVTFPRAYATAPLVIGQRDSTSGTSPKIHVYAAAVTTTGFTMYASVGDGTTSANTISCKWVAIGDLA